MDSETKEQFDSINAQFDSLKDFLVEHMVTKQEIDDKLADLPTKEDFQNLVTVVDGYAKDVKNTNEEILVLGEKANRIGSWVKQAAAKIGVEYNP